MFHDTVMSNITLFKANIVMEDVYWAAGVADAHDFIKARPKGYEAPVGGRGTRFSGGQRQRLALARALAIRPEILLLDEATSSLDTSSERKIQEALERLQGQLTIVVVAHRLSTVLNADRIVVLEGGKIVETGNPQDLLRAGGRFSEMYALQMAQESV